MTELDDAEGPTGIDEEVEDRFGRAEFIDDGEEVAVEWWDRRHDSEARTVVRFRRSDGLLRIYPAPWQFDQVEELQLQGWDRDDLTAWSNSPDPLVVLPGLPAAFAASYGWGLGLKKPYRAFVRELERHTKCTVLRFVGDGEWEGEDGNVYRVALRRLVEYQRVVDLHSGRASTVVGRMNNAAVNNLLAPLLGLPQVEPNYGRHPDIRKLSEIVHTGVEMDETDRAELVDRTIQFAPAVASEQPARFALLRESVQLVSLKDLVTRFEESLQSHSNDEDFWQQFFDAHRFALQQIFAVPIVVEGPQVTVEPSDASGGGERVTDFLCANPIARTAAAVEIKTPGMRLLAARPHRGKGTRSAIFAPHSQLSEAVSQVQSQMESIRSRESRHFEDAGIRGLNIRHVVGAVIGGSINDLTEPQQLDSFARYRDGLVGVTVLTYDEVLERLQQLVQALSVSPEQSSLLRPSPEV